MSKIRSKNTTFEKIVFKELAKRSVYFQKHYMLRNRKTFTVDIALPAKKKAIFLDGDFWHGYQFSKLKKRLPKKYWLKKIEDNIARDRKNRAKLRREGWKVLRIWEHEIKKDPEKAVGKVVKFLK